MVPPVLAIAGVSGGPLERERTAKAPRPGDGWKAFDQLADYVTQSLPFRRQGVDANTWIADNVWGRSPSYGSSSPGRALPFESVQSGAGGGYNQTGGAAKGNSLVSTGPNGWLFLQGEFDTLCHPPIALETAVSRWRSFVDAIRKSGRKVVLLVVPEKSTVYPEQVRKDALAWRCAQRNKLRLWGELQSQRDLDIVPLLQPLMRRKQLDPGRLLYLPLNTHWNAAAAILLPQLALERLGGPVQVRPGDLHAGRKHYASDIGAFAGKSGAGEMGPSVEVSRPGDAGMRHIAGPPGPITLTHPGGPRTVLQGRVLFLHDSFGDPAAITFPHYVGHIVLAQWVESQPDEVARLIRGADTVIVETVERDFLNRAANPGRENAVLTPSFLRSLPERLGRP
jgi:hypothetical protein